MALPLVTLTASVALAAAVPTGTAVSSTWAAAYDCDGNTSLKLEREKGLNDQAAGYDQIGSK